MSDISKKATILWLSDFHFRKLFNTVDNTFKPAQRKALKEFLSSFFDSIRKHKDKITHVVFTGDLAQTGDGNDYNAFHDLFFIPLTKTLQENIQYLIIPGNHDIEWAKFQSLFTTYKGTLGTTPVTDPFTDFFSYSDFKVNFLKSNRHEYLSSFTAFLGRLKSEIHSIKIQLHTDSYIDHSSKIRFLFINSVLNSYGEIPKEVFFSNFEQELVNRGLKGTIYDLVYNKSELFSQLGQQTYLFDEIENILLSEEFKNNTDGYITLSLAHHSIDWLHRSERYSDKPQKEPKTDKLFKESNIHLVGHEHSRPCKGNYNGNCLTLNAGMFLDENVLTGASPLEQFPNNWYSLLEIDNSMLTQMNFHYNVDNDRCSWICQEPIPSYNLMKPLRNFKTDNIHPDSTFIEVKDEYLRIRSVFEQKEDEEKNKLDGLELSFLNQQQCKNILLNSTFTDLKPDFKAFFYEKGIKNNFQSVVESAFFYLIFAEGIIIMPGIMDRIISSSEDGSELVFNKIAESLNKSNSTLQKFIFLDIFQPNIDLDSYKGSSLFDITTKKISRILETRKEQFLLFKRHFLSFLISLNPTPPFFNPDAKFEFIHFLIENTTIGSVKEPRSG